MYISYLKKPKQQVSFEDLLNNFEQIINQQNFEKNTLTTFFTAKIDLTPDKIRHYHENYAIQRWNNELKTLVNDSPFLQEGHDINQDYIEFYIPKRSGGFRKIEAPTEELKARQSLLKNFIQNNMRWLPHNSAYAYVPNRCTKDAVAQHKNSNWFLKLDIHSFFPSCTPETILNHMKEVFPFCFIQEETLQKTVAHSIRNGHLPQGTPLSPILTNIIMVPFDYTLRKCLPKEMVYTRYADDILISSPYQFSFTEIQNRVKRILEEQNYPFTINTQKTRYGSINGRNWNLGLMLNKDHNITVGHAKKQRIKAALFNFFNGLTKGNTWDKIDVQTLQGLIAYGISIEPEYFNNLIKRYNQKFGMDFHEECKKILKS